MLQRKTTLKRGQPLRRKSLLRQKPWEKQEERIAEDFGGQRVKGSGNKWFNPGDIKTDDFLIQTKQTSKNSYRLTAEEWEKTCVEALHAGRLPLQIIEFGDSTEIVVMSRADFEGWLKEEEEKND